jgi:ATP-binding cassette subfamily B protein
MKSYNRKTPMKMNVFQTFVKLVPKIIKVSPLIFFIGFFLNLVDGVIFGSITYITQILLDSATGFVSGENEIITVVYAMIAWGAVQIIWQVNNGVAYFMNMMYLRKAQGHLSLEIHEKISRLDPICFEDPEILDGINKAEMGKNAAASFVNSIMIVINVHTPYFICMSIYLYNVKPLLIVSLLLIFMPTLLTQILRAKIFDKAEDASASVRRECLYYEKCITGREYLKETRILGAFSYFREKYIHSLRTLNKLVYSASVKSDIAELGMKLLSLFGYVGILIMLFESLMNREISVGAFAAIFGAVGQMFSRMEEVMYRNFGSAARDFGLAKNYLKFLDLDERVDSNTVAIEDGDITLRNVSFSYPGAQYKAIDDVELTIRRGETVAIVGENGSGKSTLVRLITGLYLPDVGDVQCGNINTKAHSLKTLYSNISAVFQKYQQYQMTMRENIGISDVKKVADDDSLDIVCEKAGINSNDSSFVNGYETMLSREFDGVDLSGGQWQRIAIARCIFRSSQLIILDEPTAAIDPIEEAKIYNRFAEIAKGKTVLIVTHRLGSIMLADRIVVMKKGRVIEQGVHEKLMELKGEYARMYNSQKQWYHTF